MSRTRKDRPNWVRSNDPQERREAHHQHDFRYYAVDHCTIDEPQEHGAFYARLLPCRFTVVTRKQWWDAPTSVDVHDRWYGPERADVRDALMNVKAQHRAGVSVDEIDDSRVSVRRHRHTPWGDGYWD